MIEHVQEYCDYVRAVVDSTGGELFVETRLLIDAVIPETENQPPMYGTSDAIVVTDNELYVIDLKYGRNVFVPVVRDKGEDGSFTPDKLNAQAMCYATGAFDLHDDFGSIERIHLAIYQSRMDNISEISFEPSTLESWIEIANQKYADALLPNAPRTPTDKGCQFCSAKPTCKPYIANYMQEIADDFEGYDSVIETVSSGELVDPNIVTYEELSAIHQKSKQIRDILDNTKKILHTLGMNGEEIPDHYMGIGNKVRTWKDIKRAETAFKRKLGIDVAMPRQLLSPTQMEVLVDKEGVPVKKSRVFKDHVHETEGQPVLTHNSKNKPKAIIEPVDNDFDDFEDDEEPDW